MLPVAFAQQRAFLPKRTNTKHQQQETSWPKKLKEKTSVRSLKSASPFPGLRKFGGSSSSLPRSPGRSPAIGNLTPPVPRIPMRYAQGSQEPLSRPSPFLSANMPTMGVDARVRPSTAEKERMNMSEISPFLAYENLAPTKSPVTPTCFTPSLQVPGSTATLNTLGTSPSREFPSGPDDPFWDEAVARVKATVRLDQEEERRERKATAKAERKFIRNVSKDRDGHLKWAKRSIEMLAGKYDEHGWLPKKDPKEFDNEDWNFVLEVLNHKDTKALRDRLFKRPEWIEADRTRREKYNEEMRTNPTPEYLAVMHAKEHEERRDYRCRKILGLLTAEELEAERRKESPLVGLGISSATEPATPLTASTMETSETTGHSLLFEGMSEPEYRGRLVNRSEHEETPTRRKGHKHGISSVARHSVEQMTDVFNTESFNPRLSILGSEELKQYIKKNPPTGPGPLTPTPDRSHFNTSLDPRQGSELDSSPGLWLSSKAAPAQRLRTGKKAASSNDMLGEYSRQKGIQIDYSTESPVLPALSAHPAFRVPESATASTARPTTGSQIPRLRKAASSIAPLNSTNASGGIRHQVIDASLPELSTTPSLQRPPKPRKPSTDVKLPRKPTTAVELPSQPSPGVNPPSKPKSALKLPRKPATTPTSASRLSPVHELQETGIDSPPKSAPLIRRPSTSVKSPRIGSPSQSPSDTQPQPSTPAKPQGSAVGSPDRPLRHVDSVSMLLPFTYSRHSPGAKARGQRRAVDSYGQLLPDTQPVSLLSPLSYSRPSPDAAVRPQRPAVDSYDKLSPDTQPVSSPLPLSYSRPSASAVAGSSGRSTSDKQPVSSPLPLSYSRPSIPAELPSDRQPVPTPLLLNYTRSSASASDGFYVQSPPDEQHASSPQGLAYALLPPRPASHSSNDSTPDGKPLPSPRQVGYSDPLPATAVIPFTTFVANDGDDHREYQFFAPIPLPDNLPPRSLARLSQIPSFPDACDFSAAVDEDQPEGPFELPATPVKSPSPVRSTIPVQLPAPVRSPTPLQSPAHVRSPTPVRSTSPVRSTTPMDRLNAKRSGIPVATASNVSGGNPANAGVEQSAASLSPFNIGPYFPPESTSVQPVQDTSQERAAFPPLSNVSPSFPSEPVNLQSASTTGQRIEASPMLNVGPYFPPGPVTFGLDQNTGQKRDAPTESHHVSSFSSPGRLTFQPHQTTASEENEPIRPSQVPNIPNNDFSPVDATMANRKDYQGTKPLANYHGDCFEKMVNTSGTHNATTERLQMPPQHDGSHFGIMVDSSSTTYQPDFGETQEQAHRQDNQSKIMVDASSMMHDLSPKELQGWPQHQGNRFELTADSSDTRDSNTEQSQPSIGRRNADMLATPHVHIPAVVGSHMQEDSSGARSPRAGIGRLLSKQLRFGSSSTGREQQSAPSHVVPSSKIPSFRSFSENKPPPGHRQPAAQGDRSISFGSPQSGTSFIRNERATTNAGRLAQKFENMNQNVPATAPLKQNRRFESFTPTKIRSPSSDGSSAAPISTRSRLRNKFSNVFFADPPPEQPTFNQDQQPTSRANSQDQHSTSSTTGALDADFENVISAWESSSPAPIQSPAPFQNQEIQTLRSEIGLEPLSGHVLGEQKHPNHSYTWSTKKIMCRRIHNQGYVLPSLPSPAPGQKAYMADRGSEYFVGSPYTEESAGALRCATCDSCCCRFAELSAQSKAITKDDIVAVNEKRQTEETVASLRAKKPNGVEEWDSFPKCSQCDKSYCPNCIKLCKEVLCQQPVCMSCVEDTELCPIHNMF
jgi:hypothetical protein